MESKQVHISFERLDPPYKTSNSKNLNFKKIYSKKASLSEQKPMFL